MPNKNYLSGRRLEYEVCQAYKSIGGNAARTAGSHGIADVVAIFHHSGYLFDDIFPGFDLVGTPVRVGDPIRLARIGKNYIDTLYVWRYRGDGGWQNDNTVPASDFEKVHLIQCKRKKRAKK